MEVSAPQAFLAATLGWRCLAKKAHCLAHRARGALLTSLLALGRELLHHQESRPECKGGAGSILGPACLHHGPRFHLQLGLLEKRAHKMCCYKQMLMHYRKNSEPNQPSHWDPGSLTPNPGHCVWSRLSFVWEWESSEMNSSMALWHRRPGF